jgi:hypothetical protein
MQAKSLARRQWNKGSKKHAGHGNGVASEERANDAEAVADSVTPLMTNIGLLIYKPPLMESRKSLSATDAP